jgi:hypothetical protein
MNTSRPHFIGTVSWLALALPFIAYGLCAWSLAHPWHDSGAFASVDLTRRYAFLASVVVAAVVLLTDAGFREWRQTWKPLAALALTGLLYALADRFTAIF